MWTARLARSMVTFVRVASARDLPPGEGRVVVVQGHPVALFNVEGRFFAVSNVCLHRGGPIGEGMLDDAVVTCPNHGWEYDVRTGANVANPMARLRTFEVRVDGDDVLVGARPPRFIRPREVRGAVALDLLWLGLTVLAVLALIPNLVSLIQGVRLRTGVRRGMRMAYGAYLPPVAVILPVRGVDEGFDDNVRALLSQGYPRYRLLVVVDDSEDPAVARIQEISRALPRVPVSVIVSNPSPRRGAADCVRARGARADVRRSGSIGLPRVVFPSDDDGDPLPAGGPPIRGGRVFGHHRIDPVRNRMRGHRGLLGTSIPVARGAVLRAAADRGGQSLPAATIPVLRRAVRRRVMARCRMAFRDRVDGGPMGHGVRPRSDPQAHRAPLAGSDVQRHGPSPRPTSRGRPGRGTRGVGHERRRTGPPRVNLV